MLRYYIDSGMIMKGLNQVLRVCNFSSEDVFYYRDILLLFSFFGRGRG